GGGARLRIVSARKIDRSKLELYFQIVWLQVYEFLEQRIGLNKLPLVDVNDAQLTQRRQILGRTAKHLAIVHLCFVPLPGGKSCIGARQKLLFGGFVFGAAGTRDDREAKHGNQPQISGTSGCNLGRHGCRASRKSAADHGRAAQFEQVLVGVDSNPHLCSENGCALSACYGGPRTIPALS